MMRSLIYGGKPEFPQAQLRLPGWHSAEWIEPMSLRSLSLLLKRKNHSTTLWLYSLELLAKTKTYKTIQGDRGKIYDRNNKLLAVETQKCTFWTNTIENSEKDKEDIIQLFLKEFPESEILYKELLTQDREYLVIKDDLVSYYHDDLIKNAKNIKSLRIDYNNHRLYPYNKLAAQVIGFTDKENKGRYGIEKFFDNILSGSREVVQYNKTASGRVVFSKNTILPKNGSDIFLTIDINIQDILQKQLLNGIYNIDSFLYTLNNHYVNNPNRDNYMLNTSYLKKQDSYFFKEAYRIILNLGNNLSVEKQKQFFDLLNHMIVSEGELRFQKEICTQCILYFAWFLKRVLVMLIFTCSLLPEIGCSTMYTWM